MIRHTMQIGSQCERAFTKTITFNNCSEPDYLYNDILYTITW